MSIVVGANWHGIWEEQKDPAVRNEILNQLQRAGVTSVRLDFAWGQLEPEKGYYYWDTMDIRVQEASDHGMTVLVMLYWPNPWAVGSGSGKGAVPRNPAEYGNICGQLGKRYGNKLAGVEMWNEPDLDHFWSGTRQQYFDLIAGAYPVAKDISPNTTFLAAAPTYLGLHNNWFRDAYNTNAFAPGVSYDVCCIHPYMSSSNLPPDAPASDYSIHGIAELQEMRVDNGDTSPLWATEFGWSVHTNTSNTEPWNLGVSEDEQASFTVDAYDLMESYDVAAAYVYTDRNVVQEPPNTHQHGFGLLNTDNSPKPVADAMASRVKPPPSTGDPELEARVAALEERVTALEEQNAELATNLDELAQDLAE